MMEVKKSVSALRTEAGSAGSASGSAVVERHGSLYDELPLPPVNTIHNFFKQQRKMNYHNYMHTKKHEKSLLKQNRAAVFIQSYFRGWLVRQNFKLLHACATKIQALWRRALARIRYVKLDNERKAKRRLEMMDKSAVKVQALFRGYMSRKNGFDFKVYKDITAKNAELEKSVERINDLEEALFENIKSKSGVPPSKSSSKTKEKPNLSGAEAVNEAVRSLEKILEKNSLKDLDNIAPSRILEIVSDMNNELDSKHSSIAGSERGSPLRGSRAGSEHGAGRPKRGSTGEHGGSTRGSIADTEHGGSRPGGPAGSERGGPGGGSKTEPPSDGLKRGTRVEGQLAQVDSVLEMFPELPDQEGIYHTDAEKIDILKKATRNLHDKILAYELEKFYKIHFLQRTAVIPGVYSDIYTNRLTEIERKLKSLKFWDESRLSTVSTATSEGRPKLQEESFAGASEPGLTAEEQEKQMLNKIYDFKINYFLPPPEPEDLELLTPAATERPSTISLPAWKR